MPIHVGKSISDKNLNMQADNELNGMPCENISEKNESYCELTAMYWAWKNIKKLYPEIQYIGLMHYRRFFAIDESRFFDPEILKSEHEINNYRVNAQKIMGILDSGRSIFPKPYSFKYSVAEHYIQFHIANDYETFKEIIRVNFLDYYDDFIACMENNNKLSAGNMFIMKYDDFAKYCEWLFAVLSSTENRIPYQDYDSYQKRVFGFMAERLLNVYIRKNKLVPEYLNIYKYEEGSINIIIRYMRVFIKYVIKKLIFKFKR